jgi:hypothetical protein
MDYQGNSHKKKEAETSSPPEKKIERLELESKVVSRKKPIGARVKSVFFGGEFDSAVRYIGAEVLLPAFRNLLVDATTKGIERMVYGESNYPRQRTPEYRPRVTYNSPINRGPRANIPDQPSRPQRARHDDTEIVFGSRGDAELVLDRMQDIIEQYVVASMGDLNEIVGLPTSPIDNKWGWDNVRHAEIRQTRDGFILNLPPAQPI